MTRTTGTELRLGRDGRTGTKRKLVAAATAGLMLIGGAAFADQLKNDANAAGNNTITAGGTTSIDYYVNATGGSCDASVASPVVVTINTPPGVTKDTNALSFTACGNPNTNTQAVEFGAAAQGSYPITHTVSSNITNQADFTLTVNAATSTNTAPVITVPADITVDPNQHNGATVAFTVTATDLEDDDADLDISCVRGEAPGTVVSSGDLFGFGTTKVTCTATDSGGLTDTDSFLVTVNNFGFDGFYAPVNNDVINMIKGGNTVPLKFNVSGATDLDTTNTDIVKSFKVFKVACNNIGGEPDEVDFVTSGSTSLRYADSSFIQNWKTPTGSGCYRVELTLNDNQVQSLNFQTRK